MRSHLLSNAVRTKRVVVVAAAMALCVIASAILGTGRSQAANARDSANHQPAVSPAIATRVTTVRDRATTHFVHGHGLRIEEQGQISGTLSGPLTLHLTTVSTYRVSVEFVAYLQGGSISGQGLTHFHVSGSTGYFTGTLAITHGSGRYAHARASALAVNGTMDRHSFKISVSVVGQMQW
jgi:hypothetical protein